MSTYVIVSILEPEFPHAFRNEDWPLHVTLLRPFSANVSRTELASMLEEICAQHKSLVTEGKSEELFGVDADVPVTELVHTPELQKLHDDMASAYRDQIEFTTPQFPDFRPHVTKNKGKGIEVGEQVSIRALSLVEITPETHKVLATFQLN